MASFGIPTTTNTFVTADTSNSVDRWISVGNGNGGPISQVPRPHNYPDPQSYENAMQAYERFYGWAPGSFTREPYQFYDRFNAECVQQHLSKQNRKLLLLETN